MSESGLAAAAHRLALAAAAEPPAAPDPGDDAAGRPPPSSFENIMFVFASSHIVGGVDADPRGFASVQAATPWAAC